MAAEHRLLETEPQRKQTASLLTLCPQTGEERKGATLNQTCPGALLPMPYEAAPQPQHGASGHGALGDGFAQQCPGSLFLYLRWVLVSAG